MRLNRITAFAIFLGVACLMLTGSALAGTTTVSSGAVNYAREVGAVNTTYTLPAVKNVTRLMNVVRNTNQDFFFVVQLSGGAQFATGSLPTIGNLGYSDPAGGASTQTIVAGGTDGSTSVTYFVDVTTTYTGFPTMQLATGTWTIRDTANVLGGGGTIQITVTTLDSSTNSPFDTGGTDTRDFMVGLYAVGTPVIVGTTAVVDVASGRLNFLATAPDTLTQDYGATVSLPYSSGSIFQANAGLGAYALLAADSIKLTIAGALDGISSWQYDAANNAFASGAVTDGISSSEVTAGSSALTITGANLTTNINAGARALRINVNGTSVLSARTLTIQVDLVLSGGTSGPAANSRNLLGATTLTVWRLNGTILVANWMNGNNTAISSRMYLWNPSSVAGIVVARVFTLPVGFGGSTLLGTVNLGTLAGTSGANVRLAEDLLTPLGIALPYTTNGGNLIVEFTIQATGCSGFSQAFTSSFAYGTCNMTVVQ